jgi:hypothetical protein
MQGVTPSFVIPLIFPALFYFFQFTGLVLTTIALSLRCNIIGWIGLSFFILATLTRIAEHSLGYISKSLDANNRNNNQEEDEIDSCSLHPVLVDWLLTKDKREKKVAPTAAEKEEEKEEDGDTINPNNE